MPRTPRKSKAAHKPRIDPQEVYRLIDQELSQADVGRQLRCDPSYISQIVKRRREGTEPPIPNARPRSSVDGQRKSTTHKIPLTDLSMDAGTQMRAQPLLTTIADYAEAMADGTKFPPILVYSDGDTHWLVDGFQRAEAAKSIGYVEIEAEIRPGTLREAILFACGANATHGQRRTDADKQKSVATLLNDPEWSKWSDRHMADTCGVSPSFVAKVRQSRLTIHMDSEDSRPRQYVNKHGTITTMDTSKIGKRASGEPTSPPIPAAVEPAATFTLQDGWTFHEPPKKPLASVEPPSRELPFVAPEPPPREPDVGVNTNSSAPATPPTPTSWLPQLVTEALAQLQHLGDAANLEGYSEYQDLRDTLTALQEHIGQEVPSHA